MWVAIILGHPVKSNYMKLEATLALKIMTASHEYQSNEWHHKINIRLHETRKINDA